MVTGKDSKRLLKAGIQQKGLDASHTFWMMFREHSETIPMQRNIFIALSRWEWTGGLRGLAASFDIRGGNRDNQEEHLLFSSNPDDLIPAQRHVVLCYLSCMMSVSGTEMACPIEHHSSDLTGTTNGIADLPLPHYTIPIKGNIPACCVAARLAGQVVGGAIEGGIVDVIWTAGGALIGGAVEGDIVDVVWTTGSAVLGGAVKGGIADVVCTAGGVVAGGM
ncbi:hypothetical protein DFH08DRAFT_827993 [Mycena albidolilacea]|uniref:Uncharacterized protein n=1 Tax=Mycena albidolilacea TaxID=1033008 RepID=A0AAD7E6K0_9AGAR|nr:hypothetical protein DFH08DRAFT_827993 [Mycena albidolilacea]